MFYWYCCIMVWRHIILARCWWRNVYLRWVGVWLWQWMYQKTNIYHSCVIIWHC